MTLEALLQRHAGGFGRVHAAGDWSDAEFRRGAGPLLLAFARQVHLLPEAEDAAIGSALDGGLAHAADLLLDAAEPAAARAYVRAAVLQGAAAARAARARAQAAMVLHALAPRLACTLTGWQVMDADGRELDLLAAPLLDQLAARAQPAPRQRAVFPLPSACLRAPAAGYAIAPAPGRPRPPVAATALHPLGVTLLLRQVPGTVLRWLAEPDPRLLAWACAADAEGACADEGAGEDAAQGGGAQPLPAGPVEIDAVRAAMERLVAAGCWTVNRRRARLWSQHGALYLVWKTAARELLAELGPRVGAEREDPAAAARLLDRLLAAGIVKAWGRPGGVDGTAALGSIRTEYTEVLHVVELADPGYWLRRVPAGDAAAAGSPGGPRAAG